MISYIPAFTRLDHHQPSNNRFTPQDVGHFILCMRTLEKAGETKRIFWLMTYITTSNLAQFQNDWRRMAIPYIRRIRIDRGYFLQMLGMFMDFIPLLVMRSFVVIRRTCAHKSDLKEIEQSPPCSLHFESKIMCFNYCNQSVVTGIVWLTSMQSLHIFLLSMPFPRGHHHTVILCTYWHIL